MQLVGRVAVLQAPASLGRTSEAKFHQHRGHQAVSDATATSRAAHLHLEAHGRSPSVFGRATPERESEAVWDRRTAHQPTGKGQTIGATGLTRDCHGATLCYSRRVRRGARAPIAIRVGGIDPTGAGRMAAAADNRAESRVIDVAHEEVEARFGSSGQKLR